MSIVSTIKPTSTDWIHLVAWAQVALGLAGLLAVLVSASAGLVAGVAVALLGLAVRALGRASRTMDGIFAEELD